MKFVKRQDLCRAERQQLSAENLLGVWVNTNKKTRGITRIVVTREGEELRLRVFGAREPEPFDWGETDVKAIFADGVDSTSTIAFTAEYDFGFLQTELQSNLSKGLLVVSGLNTFKDGSPRANYFSREFFHKQPEV